MVTVTLSILTERIVAGAAGDLLSPKGIVAALIGKIRSRGATAKDH
jgi:hypothetical protein